jgi:hypothetical protein
MDFSGNDAALIYGGGVGTLYVLPAGRLDISLGGKLTMARQNIIDGGIDNGFSMLELGLDLNHPLFTTRKKRRYDGGLFFIYTPFIDDLDIIFTFPDEGGVKTVYQLGFHVGVDPPFDLRILELERFGVTFLGGDSFGAIKINSGFPF